MFEPLLNGLRAIGVKVFKPKKRDMRWFFTDECLKEEAGDKFGHTSFVDTLDKILNECNPPFSIGVFGTWGLGKTTIAKFLAQRLKKVGWDIVHINLWKYSSTSLRRKILIEIVRELHKEKGVLDLYDKLYYQKEFPVSGGIIGFIKNYLRSTNPMDRYYNNHSDNYYKTSYWGGIHNLIRFLWRSHSYLNIDFT